MTKKKAAKARRLADREHRATGHLARWRGHPVVKALSPLSEASDQPPLIALGIGTLAAGAVLRNRTLARSGARMLASHLVATGIKTVLKAGVDRTRPSLANRDGHGLGKGKGTGDHRRNAFPSGHTAGAVAVAEAVSHEAPGLALPARAAAGLVGALQLPRGSHYYSDVVAGAAVGWLGERIAGIALAAADRWRERRRDTLALAESEAHPS